MRWSWIGFGAGLCYLALMSPALATDKPEVGPVPSWVTPIPLSPARDITDTAPVHVIIDDTQAWFHGDTTSLYVATVVRITKPEGLTAMGTIALQWKPDTDRITIHAIRIRRGDKVIDALGDGHKIDILRRENNLELAMINGVLTAATTLEGLQVGDAVELTYTIDRTDPLLKGHHDLVLDAGTQGSADRLAITAHWEKGDAVQQRSRNLYAPLRQTALGVALEADAITPLVQPQGAPARYLRGRQIEFSDYHSWGDVSGIFTALFDSARKLKPDSPLNAEIARIKTASPDPAVRAGLALALVQSHIRYLFIGLNQAGLKPTAADDTWQRRFGDCKAKTAILLALLDGLGIAAEPALVSVNQGDGLDQRLPNVGQFDHVIVRASIGGKTYWLDATRTGDKDITKLRVPEFRWALPLHQGSDRLEQLVVLTEEEPSIINDLHLDASKGLTLPADASGEMTFRGDTGRATMLALAAVPRSQLEASLRAIWTKQYDFITPTTLSEHWDEATATEHLLMRGTAKMEWNFDRPSPYYELDGAGVGWRGDYLRETGPYSDAPFAISYPLWGENRETVILPGDGSDFTIEGTSVDKVIAQRHIFRELDLKGNVVTMVASQKPLAPELGFAEAKAAEAELRTLAKNSVYINLNRAQYEMTKPEIEAALAAASGTGDADFKKRLTAYTDLHRTADGLAEAERYVAAFPQSPDALSLRSRFQSLAGHDAAAREDFAKALALDPDNTLGRLMQNYYQFRDKEAGDEVPDVVSYVFAGQAQACYRKDDIPCTLRNTNKAIEYQPTLSMLYVLRANAYRRQGHDDLAAGEADRMIAALPKDADVQAVAGVIYCSTGHCETGMKAFATSLAIEPNVVAYLNRIRYLPKADAAGRKHDIDAALKLDPDNRETLIALADWQREAGDTAGETATLDRLGSLSGGDIRPKIQLAMLYARANQPDRARVLLAEARGFAAASRDASLFNNMCYDAAQANFDLTTALADCQQAITFSPSSAPILDSLGFVQLRLGRYASSVASYNKVLAIDTNDAHSLYGRGLARRKNGAAADGDADIAAALKLDPDIADEFTRMGVTR